jgi:hypothetical protein
LPFPFKKRSTDPVAVVSSLITSLSDALLNSRAVGEGRAAQLHLGKLTNGSRAETETHHLYCLCSEHVAASKLANRS